MADATETPVGTTNGTALPEPEPAERPPTRRRVLTPTRRLTPARRRVLKGWLFVAVVALIGLLAAAALVQARIPTPPGYTHRLQAQSQAELQERVRASHRASIRGTADDETT